MTEKLGVIAFRPNLPKFGNLGVQYLQTYAIEGCEGWPLFGWGLESACHCTQAEAQKYFPECEWIPLEELE